MARSAAAAALALLIVSLAVPASSGPKPRASAPRKPPAAKPAPPATAPEPAPEPPAPPPADVKVVSSYTQGAQVSQNTTFVRGARQRVEFAGVVTLDQCDLARMVILNPAAKKYRVQPYTGTGPATPQPAPAPPTMPDPGQQEPRGGVVTITTTLTDTLERQTLFGLEARRVKTLVTKQSDANACDRTPLRVEIDAWYVNLPGGATCHRPAAPPQPDADGGCRDRVEARMVGDVSLGFPVKTVTTTTSGEKEKQQVLTTSAEVSSLEITNLDAALFEVPADYTEASSGAELLPQVASGGSLEDVLFGSTADGTGQAAPKRPGVTRIGVLEPINRSNRTLPTRLLRQDLAGRFKGSYEALPLSGSSAADIEADARRLECDYILLAEITDVKTSKPGKLGGFLKAASGGGPPKDVHEVKVRYSLYAASSTSSPRASGDLKASSGGGFGIGSALRVASFAGQMYMSMGMMRGMRGLGGLGYGMNPMAALGSMGGVNPTSMGYFDPRAAAMSSMSLGMMNMAGGPGGMPGMSDPSEGEMYQTVSEALESVAKAAPAKLSARK